MRCRQPLDSPARPASRRSKRIGSGETSHATGEPDRIQDWAAPKWLQHPNIELFVPRRSGAFANLRKLHHKLMVIDELIVVAGSFNYTEPANAYNDENIFVMGSTHTGAYPHCERTYRSASWWLRARDVLPRRT